FRLPQRSRGGISRCAARVLPGPGPGRIRPPSRRGHLCRCVRLTPLEPLQAGTKRILTQGQLIARPVGDEGGGALDARGQSGVVAEDGQPRARMGPRLGSDGDERRVILLVAALDEPVVADLTNGALRQVDHVVRTLALCVVEARAGNVDSLGPALHVVSAAAFFEAAARDPEVPVLASVDRVSATPGALAGAEPGEG